MNAINLLGDRKLQDWKMSDNITRGGKYRTGTKTDKSAANKNVGHVVVRFKIHNVNYICNKREQN